jgi:glycosyltransferase involved in cell wall biosynthesis
LPHVVHIGFFKDPGGRSPSELLEAWPTLVDVAEAAARTGIEVSVVQASAHAERLQRHRIDYHFLPFGDTPLALQRNAAFGALLRALAPDVLHIHGLCFPREVLALAALLPRCPIVLQDHANGVPRLWRRPACRRGLSVAAGIAFCALEQARPFTRAQLIRPDTPLYEVPEATSRFMPGDRDAARRLAGISGDPAVLWVGHLNSNKDPLTVLEGVSAAACALPRLRLYCCFGTSSLLPQVRRRISADPELRGRVELLGRVPHERIEHLMRAADLFVLGSHREGSGYSLIEALACGLPPVVTDIPSFRTLTAAGAVGVLWRHDDAPALCAALQSAAAQVSPATRAAVRAHFERELSFDALGAKLLAMYADVLARHRHAPLGMSLLAQAAS